MRVQRGRVIAGVLMVLGALVGSGAVWFHWRACTGPQVVSADWGSAEDPGPVYGDACLQAMDDGFSFLYPDGKDPFRPESLFGLALALLVAASWAVALLTGPWRRSARTTGAVTLGLVLLTALLALQQRSDTLDLVFSYVQVALSAGVLLTLVLVLLQDTSSPRDLVAVALALVGPGAVGLLALLADYVVMGTVSEATWDTPPWSGIPTLVATAVAGAVLVVMAVREGRAARADTSAA